MSIMVFPVEVSVVARIIQESIAPANPIGRIRMKKTEGRIKLISIKDLRKLQYKKLMIYNNSS